MDNWRQRNANKMNSEANRAYRKWSKPKKPKKKPEKKWIKVKSEEWVNTQKEYLSWRKTEDFLKWSRKQYVKQGGLCYYCDLPLRGARQNVEHIIPKIYGGSNHRSNLALACAKCNAEKNTKVLSFKERQELKNKNLKKRGTYLKNRDNELFMTNDEYAAKLRQLHREDF